jgi:VWFA-related protein
VSGDHMERTRFFAVAASAVFPAIFTPFLTAQTAADANSAMIRAEAREVLIDVTVAGRKNASPGDLTAKDFAVWEDGKRQKITSVSSARADPETVQKHFVLFFDFSTMSVSEQAVSKKYAAGFIGGLASPDRYMAVASLNASGAHVLQDFTTASAALRKAVELPADVRGQAPNSQQGMVAAGSSGKGPIPLAAALEAVAGSLAPAPGRKALLLFTGGYGDSDFARFKQTIAACNRANVAVYVIAGSAGAASSNLSAADSRRVPDPAFANLNPVFVATMGMNGTNGETPANFARLLADGTGGEALGLTETLPDQLAAVAREQDEYYRVAYAPPPAKEGSCHTLRVTVNTRGLETRARNEYCTEKPVDLVAGKIAGQALEVKAAEAARGSLQASAQLPYFYTGTNRASIHLSVEIVPAGMRFDKNDKAGLHGQIDLVGTAVRPDGGTVARFADTVDVIKENQQQADAFTHTPYHYEHQFTVAAGTYVFQLAIGAGPNAVGKLEMPLNVETWNSGSFGIGGIALSTEMRPAEAASASASSTGAPALEGRAPLVAGGRQFVPAATNRFRNSDHVFFYTEVYEPTLGGANPSTLKMQVRVLDRKTGELRQDTGMAGIAGYVHPGNPVVPFATAVPVAQLPAGSYRLEVRAAHSSGPEVVARTVDFEVN